MSQFTKALNNTYELPDWLKVTNETTDPLIILTRNADDISCHHGYQGFGRKFSELKKHGLIRILK